MKLDDLACIETWPILQNKVLPGLEEAARKEFTCICGPGDIGRQEIREIRARTKDLKAFVCSYLDGLCELHCIHNAVLYGDRSAKKEVRAAARRGGE